MTPGERIANWESVYFAFAGKAYSSMLITRIELENIKSYRRVAIDLRRGTTAISGPNGAGKTTLVEAIGYALFGYLPYNQEQFVREGEKYGIVTVCLIGGDDRPYTVERRCGSGARWLIHDEEANARIEQRTDVLDKLHELFGIDRERPLDSLFRDALGVPQGTFTAIFLEAASKRKQTFDALLQIEDYKVAFENLLETQRYYKEQMQGQQSEINRLTYETRELEEWRDKLKDARLLDEQQKEQNVRWSEQLTRSEARLAVLNEELTRLTVLDQRYQASKAANEHARQRLHDSEQLVQAARNAQQIIVASHEDHQRYRQAQDILLRLRRDAQTRDSLLLQQTKLKGVIQTTKARIDNWQERLTEVASARQKVTELAPQVEQQTELEKKRDEAMQRVSRYDAIVTEGKRLNEQLGKNRNKQEELQRKIIEIEPLVPIAERLPELTETLTQLRIQSSERTSKRKQLQEKHTLLQERQLERDQTAERLRKVEHSLTVIEEHRQEAEEMPVLQAQYEQLVAQKNRLEGNIEGYARSRAQSAGGQCPLLNESCLNIKQRGIVSLEFYFENLLTEEHKQIENVMQQQSVVSERMEQIKKFADALNKLGQFVERRELHAEQLQRIAIDITRLERDISTLNEELEALKRVDERISEIEAAYNESKKADARVREIAGLYKQIQQLQEQARQYESDLQERRREIEGLRGAGAQLKQVEADLEALNDPRARTTAQQAIIAQEGHFTKQLQVAQQQQQQTAKQLQELQEQLVAYTGLDDNIAQQDAIMQSSERGFQDYLQNEKEARLLPEREQTYRRQQQQVEQSELALQEIEQAYHAARDAFNQQELDDLKGAIEQLKGELAALAQKMQHHQEYINELEQKIAQAEALLTELEAAQQEYRTLEDLYAMVEQFRKLIKEAAPYVLKALLGDISAEANRIFGEVMGDRSAQLSWQNDYEIILRRQGVNRTFAQLSGGEQMSAALAVRLALLKKLSTLNLAFFDEPTQNMDELRRMNLAEQIRRVRGFDQLIVISHDDTFEQGLDSLVRLHKHDGETLLMSEDEIMAVRISQREQVNTYAS